MEIRQIQTNTRQLQQELEREKKDLEQQIERLSRVVSGNAVDEPFGDFCDQGKLSEYSIDQAIKIRVRTGKLNLVNTTLDLIHNGRYGYCAKCGKPIPPDRLGANVHARLCMECEKKEKEQPHSLRRHSMSDSTAQPVNFHYW